MQGGVGEGETGCGNVEREEIECEGYQQETIKERRGE